MDEDKHLRKRKAEHGTEEWWNLDSGMEIIWLNSDGAGKYAAWKLYICLAVLRMCWLS